MLSDEEKDGIKRFYKDYNALDRLLADRVRYSNQWEEAELSLKEIEERIRFLRSAIWARWVRVYSNTNPVMDKHEIPKTEYCVVIKEMPLVERGWMSLRDAGRRQTFKQEDLKLALDEGFRMAESTDLPIEVSGVPIPDEFAVLMIKHNTDLGKRGIVIPNYKPDYSYETKLLKDR